MSYYQTLKIFLLEHIDLSRDGFHIFLGFAAYLIICSLFRLKLSSFKSLIAPIVMGIVLELIDIRDMLTLGVPLVPLGNLKDVVTTSLLPFLTTLYLRRTERHITPLSK